MPLFSLIDEIDATIDWISTVRMGVLTSGLKQVLPPGFWGDHHHHPDYKHPEPSSKRVYLTLDDGPSPETTPVLLEFFRQHNVKATFFLIGQECERYPELVQAIHNDGHAIGNHSWSHLLLPKLTASQQEGEIVRTQEVIGELTGAKPNLFRPPYGLMDARTFGVLSEQQIKTVYWTAVPEDWQIPGAKRVVRRVMYQLFPGSLIVLHEGPLLKKQTLAAVKEIVYSCEQRQLALDKICLTSDRLKTTPSS